ncbi:hypothetical protein ACIRU3_16765 [Streptomyces sp. NPDC101151]|uniref:hypothetical protein n=1 Tax=Streptomyces sp. NPDC101151 TaxID=3366115 RepID=UPI00380D1FC1
MTEKQNESLPSEPAESGASAEPTAPVEPPVPVDTTAPVEPTTLVEPPVPVDTTAPVEPPVPVDTTAPVEPAALVEPPVPVDTTAPVEPAAEASKPRRRGRIPAIAGSVLLAGALVAGVGYTVVTVDGADRDAGAPAWKFPEVTADKDKAEARHGLAGMLVPYGTGTWTHGPDIGEFGSDAQLSGAQATALRKESLKGLPRSRRLQLERQIDRQRVKGMAMRSYFSGQSEAYLWNEGIYSVTIVLAQMEDKAAVRSISTFQNAFLGALGGLRAGPEIKGHKNAKCFRSPKGTEEDLDKMFCSAYVGDILVTVTADGAQPLDTDGVAGLVRNQLDRIAEPGVAV